MAKNTKINLVRNTVTFIGLISTSFFCSLFLNFKNENEGFILFLIFLITSFLISYSVDVILRKKSIHYTYNSDNSIMVYFTFILLSRVVPQFYPGSLVEVILFLTGIFIVITIKNFYFDKKLSSP